MSVCHTYILTIYFHCIKILPNRALYCRKSSWKTSFANAVKVVIPPFTYTFTKISVIKFLPKRSSREIGENFLLAEIYIDTIYVKINCLVSPHPPPPLNLLSPSPIPFFPVMIIILLHVSYQFESRSQVSSNTSPLSSTCSSPCMCNSTVFEPVCGADGITYFSPCQAACQKTYIDGDVTVCTLTKH